MSFEEAIAGTMVEVEDGQMVNGTVVKIDKDEVLLDIGYKSEGVIPSRELSIRNDVDPGEVVGIGEVIEALVLTKEDKEGRLVLSKKRAQYERAWGDIEAKKEADEVVSGPVIEVVKGGLIVDIGLRGFLPASLVELRRVRDLAPYIGTTVQAKIIELDKNRNNVVLSRRAYLEENQKETRDSFLTNLKIGEVREGTVSSVVSFGAFVDLGGIDGLLHITDMAWERIGHPTEMVSIDQEIEVKVLHIDREKQKIALGLKQKDRNPWENIESKYPVSSDHKGEVVNVMSYGAFVKLEPGIEGLVHISEMSWTKRVNHPSELVNIGDEIDVKILGVDPEGQQLSLGMKQTQKNPWDEVIDRYPEGQDVTGKVRNLTNYGAFIELEEGIDGLLHVSDMSWTRKIGHPSELLEKGQEIKCRVLSVDESRRRIALGLKQLDNDPWDGDI
ncbi:MAG: 30S ribosomal protein S1, partial [Ilumatobacter sp.]|nr:30S ribosomal protein S1 [Ilumatobacter sp.]